MVDEDQAQNGSENFMDENLFDNKKIDKAKTKTKKRLHGNTAAANTRGVCYLSRVPPLMNPFKLRQVLSQYGEIERIYLTPEDPTARIHRKRAGGFRGQKFSEGWVEFTKKGVAKKVANVLNGEQIGGKKRSSFYYDLWNIKYLSKFKWDDLTEELAYKNAIREQKQALELSAAKRERDFYLSKVEKSRALEAMQERAKKKRKRREVSDFDADISEDEEKPKVIRKFKQKRPVMDATEKKKSLLSQEHLAGVFGGSS